MRLASLSLMMLSLAPNKANAISLIPTSTGTPGPIAVELSAALFVQGRSVHLEGSDSTTQFALTRARIGLELRYLDIARIQIEPDFAGDEADPADVFAEIYPVPSLGVRVGRAKVPWGVLELESRWKLPSIRRGLISNVVTDRLGIGDRKLGITADLRLREVPLRPGIDVGAYRDTIDDTDTDGAVRLETRPYFKGSELSLAGYARSGISASGGYGFAGSAAFRYDDHGVYLVVEGMLVRAALVRRDGVGDEDAFLSAGRMLIGYMFKWKPFRLQPFLGLEILDPNARTRDDLGGAIRGGLNLYYEKIIRFGLEADHQRGQSAFVEPDRTTLTLFVGVFLE